MLFLVSLVSQSVVKAVLMQEFVDDLDPILFINKLTFQGKLVVILSTMLGSLIAYDTTDNKVLGHIRVSSAVNCLGSLHRSSGFRLGTTLVQIGNLQTPALSDSKCVLYAVNLPALLGGMLLNSTTHQQPESQTLDLTVATALENLKPRQVLTTLDFDLLISMDERVSNQTYI